MAIREHASASLSSNKPPAVRSSEISHTVQIDDDEFELVRRLREGDECAYETVVRKFAPRMLAVARRFLPDGNDAQDVVQNALLSAVKAIHGFAQQSQLSTWLHRIVVNAALMELRRRRHHAEDSIEDLLPRFDDDGRWLAESTNFGSLGQLAIERRETRELVRKSIAQLPESYRTVLMMRDIEDLDTSEIAQMLNASINAVKVRLHRARQALRPILEHELREQLSTTD